MRRQTGFTMIELLVTMAVAAILMYVAIPSFLTTIRNDRLVGQANDLLGALVYARSEAINYNNAVIVCASSDGSTCSGTNLATGWLVCHTDCSTATNILRAEPALSGGNTLTDSPSASTITFQGNGSVTAATNFAICDSRGASYGRSVYIYASGLTRTSPTIGKQLNGTAITC